MTTPQIPIIRLLIGEQSLELDISQLWLTECVALEEEWGLTVEEFQKMALSGSPPYRVIGAMVWLAQVRAAAKEQGIPFAQAAKANPVSGFDVNLMAIVWDQDGPEPPNPTPGGTRTRATRTTPGTSARKRAKSG